MHSASMWWQYILVFFGAMLMDIFPIPLPPAFTIMLFLYVVYDLNIWVTIAVGVAGSILGRWILTLYIPYLSGKIFTQAKNEDVQYLGEKMKQKGWKGQGFILGYSLLPLPTTPLFLAGGMARLSPFFLIPPFFVGKVISDTLTVHFGSIVVENTSSFLEGVVSWKSISGLLLGLLMIFTLLFVDWKTVFLKRKLALKFNIFQKEKKKVKVKSEE